MHFVTVKVLGKYHSFEGVHNMRKVGAKLTIPFCLLVEKSGRIKLWVTEYTRSV